MYKIIILTIILFSTIILSNVYTFKYIVNKAIKKFVTPKLHNAGLTFTSYKWLGFFNHGDFKDDKFVLLPGLKAGYPVISTYIEIYYNEALIEKKATVRIDSFFVFIVKVFYSTEFSM